MWYRALTLRLAAAVVAAAALPASAQTLTDDTPRPGPTPSSAPAGWRIVVDAGHGYPDRGMMGLTLAGSRVYEKDITLAVSRRLQRILEARGLTVVMTRTTDTLIALSDRGRIANASRGDLFVSIHVNAAPPTSKNWRGWRGVETYFLAEAKTEDARRVAAMENDVVRFETDLHAPSKDDPLSFIMLDMAQNEHLRESSELATGIQGALMGVHPGPSRGVKQAGFRVLVTAYMPAVLVEIGFGTNPDEAQYLTSDAGQSAIATAIADGIEQYLTDYGRRLGRPTGSRPGSPR